MVGSPKNTKYQEFSEKISNTIKPDVLREKASFVLNKVYYYFRVCAVLLVKYIKNAISHFKNTSIEFRKRLFTALVFVTVFLFAIAIGHIIYGIVISLICIAMIYEVIKICKNIKNENNMLLIRKVSIAYIIFCCLSIILIRNLNQGFKITVWMFFVVWSVDTFAYIFGKKYGKTKLAPTISPGKTYEGAIFGSISGLLVSMVLYSSFYMNSQESFSGISFFIFSAIVVVLSQISDLIESYVKRQCSVKDSGKLFPGHGGACDRFDSLLLVAPFVFFIALLNGGALF